MTWENKKQIRCKECNTIFYAYELPNSCRLCLKKNSFEWVELMTWEKEFDKKIKQRWSNAIYGETEMNEVKSFIKKTLKEQRSGIVEIIEGIEYKCSCGCNFKDGCLCINDRKAVNKAKLDIIIKIKEL